MTFIQGIISRAEENRKDNVFTMSCQFEVKKKRNVNYDLLSNFIHTYIYAYLDTHTHTHTILPVP